MQRMLQDANNLTLHFSHSAQLKRVPPSRLDGRERARLNARDMAALPSLRVSGVYATTRILSCSWVFDLVCQLHTCSELANNL